ncbi:MAG: two-component system response regulator [Bermanella sp.]|nr:two-component system response regulator [Bermanella sp.]|tara:strand:+ start:1479 stop:2414 length:936 start_codon:yes stop_codon:yes gene_type:complete
MKALNILVVDDARFIRDLVRKAVKAQFPSCQVDDAADGLQAQTKMKSGTYHVLLCDWEMPNMSGLELLQWMRTEERYEKIPFMMITSRSEKSHIVKAVEAGVNDYIGKPFNNEQLGTKLARLIYKFYKMSPMQTARQAQQSDNASLLTGAPAAKSPSSTSENANLLTGGAASSAKSKPSPAASANLLAGAAPSAQLVDKPKAKKGANKTMALAHVRTSQGQELRCIVKDINLNEMMLVVKRDQGVPGLFDQVVVDIVSKEEDIVARVNCFVCSVSSPDKRIDGELFNLMVRYEDEDPEKLAALSKFVAKVR